MKLPAKIIILVLDDQEQNCELIKETLQAFCKFCEVHAYTDPDQAKRFCLDHQERIIIFVTNVFLGGTTAFGFINELQIKFPMAIQDTIILTGADTPDILRSCKESGACYVLLKPYEPYQLEFAVRAIVHKYVKFAPRLLNDEDMIMKVESLEEQRHLKAAVAG